MARGPGDSAPADTGLEHDGRPGSAEGSRAKVLDFIGSHPGVHLREVCRSLDLAMGDVQYNVNRLEKEGKVVSLRRGLYRFFYPATLFAVREREVLSVLSLETPRELLLAILGNPESSQEELSRVVGVTQPTASWHLKRLVELGVIERQQRGRSAVYRMVGTTPGQVTSFLKSYHPTVWEKWSSRLADIFISYSGEEAREE